MLNPEDIERARQPLTRGWTLPPAAYTEARIFQTEQKAIFDRDWLCVARTDQLPEPGDYIAMDLFDQPIVVVRDRQGELTALSSVCLHRAMPVVAGRGNATRFTCPYHRWTYELDGRLRSAPMMEGAEGFEAADCRLPSLALEVWEGFVFVNRDPEAAPLAPRLSGLASRIERYDFSDLVVAASTGYDSPWNWKILVENFMEAYHHIGTHSTTFEPQFPARDSSVPDNGGEPWTFLHMPARAGAHENGGAGIFPRLIGDEQHQLLAMNVYPTLLFAASASGGVWYQLEPRAVDAMQLTIHFLLPKAVAGTLDDPAREELIALLRVIHDEDIEANAGPWRGLKAPMTRQGRLSGHEKAIWQLNQLWLERMAAYL